MLEDAKDLGGNRVSYLYITQTVFSVEKGFTTRNFFLKGPFPKNVQKLNRSLYGNSFVIDHQKVDFLFSYYRLNQYTKSRF